MQRSYSAPLFRIMQGEQLLMEKYGRREAVGKVQALEKALKEAEEKAQKAEKLETDLFFSEFEKEAEEKDRKEAEEKAKILEAALETSEKARKEAEEKAKILEAALETSEKARREAEKKAQRLEFDVKVLKRHNEVMKTTLAVYEVAGRAAATSASEEEFLEMVRQTRDR
jgi:chromosome segregation ATPase